MMVLRKLHLSRFLVLGVLVILLAPKTAAVGQEKKYEEFDKVIADSKTYDGLFKLYLKQEHLFAELRQDQFDRPYLAPVAIARGSQLAGHTLNFEEQWVVMFKRVGDKVQLIRRNVRFRMGNGPISKAVETTYTDSILMAMRVRSVNPIRNTVLIDFSEVFLTNFADLPFGNLDQNRTSWGKIKAFPKNIELQVTATFTGGKTGDEVIDTRGNTVVIHYGLVELPDSGYQPRLADDRVGHFITVVKDFGNDAKDTSYVRYVNRWRLERVDGSPWKEGAKLVPPKKKIVFWIEKSVPDEYRASVREGILEWNKAFEKIGFRDAIEVRQQENEDFDPEDINYNTFRWVANDAGYAMGPSRANPFTGEILDADIIFDASMVRIYKTEQQLFKNDRGQIEEPASLIEATRKGWALPLLPQAKSPRWNDREGSPLNDADSAMRARMQAIRSGFCQCATHKTSELGLALMSVAARMNLKPGDKLPDELITQVIKETVMHEVGHTLGLRHNFKASTMLKNEQLHDVAITRKNGLVGSVMDYNPANLAPKGVKQGDFFTSTIGPYDYWAIEYAYKPVSGNELEELQKIASRAAEPGLDYGTDEDMMTHDPLVNTWDLGADPMKFAQERILLSEELMKGLADRVVEKGEGYQRARVAFSLLLRQHGEGAYLTAQFVGGEALHRDHRGDPNARDPQEPVTAAKQREALVFLQQHILTDKPFQFSPELLRKLGSDRWLHWGNETAMMRGVDFPLHERILGIQRVVLNHLLQGATLSRIQNLALLADEKEAPLSVAEVFRSLSDSIFIDLPNGDKPAAQKSSVIRRNLQRAYLHDLGVVVLGGGNIPPDARSLARFHLRQIAKRIDQALEDKKTPLEDTYRAHLEESKEQIAKVLTAPLHANLP